MVSEISTTRMIRWLSAGRLAILTLLLGLTYLGTRHESDFAPSLIPLSLLLAAAYLLAACYTVWYRWGRYLTILIWTQIVLDVVLVTLAVLWTGRTGSPFTFLYPLIIVTASFLQGRVGGTASAILSTGSYAVLCLWMTSQGGPTHKAYMFFLNMAAFNITAALGFALGQRLQHAQLRLSEAEGDLRRMEQIQRHLARSLRSGLLTVDQEGRLTSFNQAAAEILGPQLATGFGRPLGKVWLAGAELLPSTEGEEDTSSRRELTHQTHSGTSRHLGVSTFPLTDEQGQHLGYGLIFQDITKAKARDERLQRMDRLAALGEMAAGLAHEIRNPLASLSGAVQFLSESRMVHPEGERLLQIIARESERLNHLTETFLLYARPECKRGQSVSLGKEVQAIVALVTQRRGLPPAELHVTVPEDVFALIDRNQLRQILLNLILNAYQALPAAGGTITIQADRESEGLILTISDNGKGIDPENLPHIFDPFFTTRPEGTGLGLSVVHRLVQACGGEIHAASQLGSGTTFTLHLPVAQSCESSDAGPRLANFNGFEETQIKQPLISRPHIRHVHAFGNGR